MEVQSEERLVRAAASGDPLATAELYRRHRPEVYRLALRLVGAPDADDVTQETMLRAFAALRRRPPRRLRPWLLTIARNESLDLLRARRGEAPLTCDVLGAESPHAEVAVREQARWLVGDLRALPERQRQAIVLRQMHELPYDAIGERLGVAPATARQAVLQARASLRLREAGRALPCAAIEVVLAAGDGRRARARDVQGHLDACAACRRVAARRQLRALLPVPFTWLAQLASRAAPGPWATVRGPGAVVMALAFAAGGIGFAPREEGRAPATPAAASPAGIQAPAAPGFASDAARVAARDAATRASRRGGATRRRPVARRAPAVPAAGAPAGAAPVAAPPAAAAPSSSSHPAAPAPTAAPERSTQGVRVMGQGAETHQEGAPSAGVYATSPGEGEVVYPDPPDHVEGPHIGGEIP